MILLIILNGDVTRKFVFSIDVANDLGSDLGMVCVLTDVVSLF